MTNQSTDLFEKVASVLRSLKNEVSFLREKVAQHEKVAKAEDLVARMESQGLIDPDVPHQEKVAALMNSGKDLDLMKEALNMNVGDFSTVTPDSGVGGSTDPLTAELLK